MSHSLWGDTLLAAVLRARSLSGWLAALLTHLTEMSRPQRLVVVQWQQRQPQLYAEYDGNHCSLSIDQPPQQLVQPLPLQEIMPLALAGELQVVVLESCGSWRCCTSAGRSRRTGATSRSTRCCSAACWARACCAGCDHLRPAEPPALRPTRCTW